MRDNVPSPRYSPVCNVLRQWKTSLIPTYRVYRLYDMLYMYEGTITYAYNYIYCIMGGDTKQKVGGLTFM